MLQQNRVMAEFEDQTKLFGREGESAKLLPPYLVIVDGPHKGARFPLKTDGPNGVGRLEEEQIVLDDPSVSRRHAELKRGEQGWVIKDLESKNGTSVNGSLIQEPVVVGHKDLLRFGIYTLRLVLEEIDPKEEMEVPPDVSDWGTVLSAEAEEEGGTRRLGVQKQVSVITAPHSPLEEEGAAPSKRRLFLKPRLWVLSATGFAVALVAGLYLYWTFVLSPGGGPQKKSEPKIVAVREELSPVPLGPPAPEIPKTIPIFLDCVANPFPAVVIFEGKEIGKTPLKVNLDLVPEKQYEIEARFEMSEIQENYTDRLQFKVTADQSMIPLLFRAPVGTIKITELPRDVSMYLEATFATNRFQAKPIKLQNIVLNKPLYTPFGRYILELRKFKEVGTPANLVEDIIFRREFELKEDAPTYLVEVTDEILNRFPAVVRSIPPGADLFIDQQKVGTTPFEGIVPVGKHILTLRKEGYFEATQELSADINMPFKTEITLQTSAAGEKLNRARNFLRQVAYENALQVLSEIFDLNPTEGETAEARYFLGKVYLAMGEYEKASAYFGQAGGHEKYKYWGKLGMATVYAAQSLTAQALVPLVDVLLNSKEEEIIKEAQGVLRQISPLRSVVYIQTDPQGAAVYLNDKRLAQATPVLLHEMALGSYRIRLEKGGYQSLDLTVNLSVNEFNPVLAKMKPLPQ